MMGSEHADAMQVAERNLSEERSEHARTERLKRDYAKHATHWKKMYTEERAAGQVEREKASDLRRQLVKAEQATRGADHQVLSLQRQLSALGDVDCGASRHAFARVSTPGDQGSRLC
jgi:hypothetical protein